MDFLKRNLYQLLQKTIQTRPLVYLNGARQTGKSTLAQMFENSNYISFDSPFYSISAKSNPENFINKLPIDVLNIIDEIQTSKEIFPYLKIAIDKNRMKGKNSQLYLLTGSANLAALPSLSQALVGRMSVLTLFPLSTSEYYKTNFNFIEKLFDEDLFVKKFSDYNLLDAIVNATFPEIALDGAINRKQWFDDYLNTLLQRDIRGVDDIRNPDKILTLLAYITPRIGSLLNKASIQREVGLDFRTFEKYMGAIMKTFIISEIKPWAKPARIEKRFIRAPKIYFNDTNFMCYLMQRDIKEIYKNDAITMGHIFENFAAAEIIKNASSLVDVKVSVFAPEGKEVDFAIERPNGDTIGIEVKLDANLSQKDFNNLYNMRTMLGEKFKKGIVLYTGMDIIPMGDRVWALPASYLWDNT
ncbi:MAG: ATP-binding protein [Endomicrobium sp.]|jgi:predicted AAA+ superfamily ATPase|nr:ATP-binding protein [Endomicrobium sp.]